jgi:O-antigen/teichoic acid export membrane protein
MARFTAGAHDPQSIRDLLRSVEAVTLAVALVIATAIWLISGWLATTWLETEQLPVETTAQALMIMGVVVGLRAIENVYRGSILGLQRQVELNLVIGLLATVRAVGAVLVLALVSSSISAYFVWQGAISAASVLLLGLMTHRLLPPGIRRSRLSLRPLRGVWRFAAGTFALTALGFILSQADKVILSSLISLSAFAVYSLAYTVASTVRLFAQPVDAASFPRMTELYLQDEQAGLAGLYHRVSQFNAVVMGSLGLFLIVFGREVLALWMQDDALATAIYSLMWILLIGMILNGIMHTPYYLQLAAGWTGLLVRTNVAMVLVFVPMTFALTQSFGPTGAAFSWVAINLTYVLVAARLMHRRLLVGELRHWYVRDLAMPLSASGAVALALHQLMPSYSDSVQLCIYLGLAFLATLLAASLAAGSVRDTLAGHIRLAVGRTS